MELKFIAQGLARSGYTVHCPMLPGMTNGTDVLKLSTWRDWYEAAEAAFDELSEHCDTVFVGGLSAGSMVALRLASQRPDEVSGNLVFAPTFWANGWAIPWYFNFFRSVWQRSVARLFNFHQRAPYGIKDERLRKFMIDSLKNENISFDQVYSRHGLMVMNFRRLAGDVKKHLNKVTHPTIIFHPRHDDQSDLSNALKLQSRLAGPVETIILDDCYHMVTLDRQRDLVLDRTLDFVARQLALSDRRRVKVAGTSPAVHDNKRKVSPAAVAAE